MNKFNYMPASPYTNPAGFIEKTTNEIPEDKKAVTRTRKKAAKNTKKTAKNKKAAKVASE